MAVRSHFKIRSHFFGNPVNGEYYWTSSPTPPRKSTWSTFVALLPLSPNTQRRFSPMHPLQHRHLRVQVASTVCSSTCCGIYRTIRAVLMGTKSCTKILNFSTRFSCENHAVEDFVTLNIEIESVPRICLLTDSVDRSCFGS